MDLSTLAVKDTSVLEITHPVTEEVIEGMSIEFYGPTSDVVRKMTHKKTQIALNRISKGKKAAELRADQLEEESIEDSFNRAVGWSGFEMKKKELEFTLENWREVMNDFPWLRAQVSEFLSNDGSFLQ